MYRAFICVSVVGLLLGAPVAEAKNYAVLISAGYTTEDDVALESPYWYDMYLQYTTLLDEGYAEDDIYVLFSNGADFNSIHPCYQPSSPVTDYAVTRANIESVFNTLAGIMTAHDFLYIWWMGHGEPDGEDLHMLIDNPVWMEYVYDYELQAWVDQITNYDVRTFSWMTCHSGGVLDNFNGERSIVMTSATFEESTWPKWLCDSYHAEFHYPERCAWAWETPCGECGPVDADGNASSQVSFAETFAYAQANTVESTPQISDVDGLAATTYLFPDCNDNAIPDQDEDRFDQDCNENGTPDFCDIATGTSEDVDENRFPDECQATLHVPAEYPTIQSAVDDAEDGDTVLIADGTYTGSGNRDIDFGGRWIIVRSEHGAARTVIDCEGQGRGFMFQSGETRDARVQGLTIRNGYGDTGGAVFCRMSSPIIENCILEDNTAYDTSEEGIGGAVWCRGLEPEVMAKPLIRNCLIRGNTAITAIGTGAGGGLACGPLSEVTVHNCTIVGNTAGSKGGGILTSCGTLTVRNSILWDNAADTGPQGAICHDGTLSVDYSDVEDGINGIQVVSGDLQWGDHNISDNPLFADAGAGNYDLQAVSPCVNTGTALDSVPVWPDADIDNYARILYDGIDRGADEYWIYGDVNHDGVVSVFDVYCVLDGIGGDFSNCSFRDSDIEPCGGNGVLNTFDVFAVLNAIAGMNPCGN